MISFIAGALVGGGIVIAAVSTFLRSTNDEFFNRDFDFDPWEEDEFWDEYRRKI